MTGGASGIGEATVMELVRAGAFVLIADINLEAAETLGKIRWLISGFLDLDVTSPKSIATAVAHTSRLDILVNNAGIRRCRLD